jgi:hypothetical protein
MPSDARTPGPALGPRLFDYGVLVASLVEAHEALRAVLEGEDDTR